MEHYIEKSLLAEFEKNLIENEKSEATVKKYVRDVRRFFDFAGGNGAVTKDTVIGYKQHLVECYEVTTVNAVLAALNRFFKTMNWYDCVVKSLKVQRDAFRSQERELMKEEYYRLLEAAKKKGNMRLYLLMQTICATGIRVSELPFITVEALCTRRARVSLKGKTRTVIIPAKLCRELKLYAGKRQISQGSIFVTRGSRPLDRSNIYREMQELCEEAQVEPKKVFPHNLRHLFACTYYQAEKDISHLADILGHSSVDTTRIYLVKSGREQEKQMELLGLVV